MHQSRVLPRLRLRLRRRAQPGAGDLAPGMLARAPAAVRRMVGEPLAKLRTTARYRAGAPAKALNLALQGGGAHGAFTWGVLDRLLEDGRVRPAAVSGASAGAMNAVALAHGLLDGGPERARESLAEFWRAVSASARYSPLRRHPLEPDPASGGHVASTKVVLLDLITRLFSPSQFNPLDFNPLRDVLEHGIDFERLRRDTSIDLHIAATDVATGNARIFTGAELSVEVLLASTCLPQFHRAVEIGGRHYWDGGFSANPPILALVDAGRAEDTLIVRIDPGHEPDVPTSARAIVARVSRLTFNAPLNREVETIERLRALAGEGWVLGGGPRRRIRRHRFHQIEAGRVTRALAPGSRLTPEWDFLCRLRDLGRAAAEAWMRRHLAALGKRSSVDLAATFL